MTIGAYKLGTMIKVSEELLNDSVFDLESYIAREFARRIGAKEEEAFFTGDGTGKPLGVLADKGGAEVGVTAASATGITADELLDLYYSLFSPYRKKAVWVVNDSTIKAIRKLKDNNGQYLWQPGLTANAPDTILGRVPSRPPRSCPPSLPGPSPSSSATSTTTGSPTARAAPSSGSTSCSPPPGRWASSPPSAWTVG